MIRSVLVTALFISPALSAAEGLRFRMDCGILQKTFGKPVKNGPFLRVVKTPVKGIDGKWTQNYTLEEINTSTGAAKSFIIEPTENGDEDFLEYDVKGSRSVSGVIIQNNFRWARLSTNQDGTNDCVPVKANYKCDADANPNRGFKDAFSVEVKGSRPGSEIIISIKGKKQVLGKITGTATIFKKQGAAFDHIIGLIHEEDISGVKDISEVDRVELLTSVAGSQEVSIFRLYVNKTQVGGTFMIDLKATSCLN